MLLQLTQQGKKATFSQFKVVSSFYEDTVVIESTLCKYMNLFAHRTENYFFNAKSLNLTARKNINFYFQIRMFWLSQQNTPTLDTV